MKDSSEIGQATSTPSFIDLTIEDLRSGNLTEEQAAWFDSQADVASLYIKLVIEIADDAKEEAA